MADFQTANGLTTGLYTFSEAAHLLRVSSRRVLGWAKGYSHARNGETRESAPILDRPFDADGLLNFYDLVELFFVREFRNLGVELPEIRAVAQELRQALDTPYPFAKRQVVELGGKLVDKDLLTTVAERQQVFEFAKEFFRDVDFDASGLAEAWHPLGKQKLIVLDPRRSFGAPIEIRSGIRTDTLFRQFKAEDQNAQAVADWYEIPLEAVEQAVEFEEKWQKAA